MTPSPDMVVRPLPDGPAPPASEVGGKAHNLARLGRLAEVPAWIVLTAHAFEAVVSSSAAGANPNAEARREAVRALAIPESLAREVSDAIEAAGLTRGRVAVRSSAVDEDGSGASFAGQFDSFLGIPADPAGEALWDAVRGVWASAFNPHATAYRERAGGESGAAVPMAVLIQEMVDPAVSGVAFSVDPVTGDPDTAVVSAVYGLGEGLVSGELDADTYRVSFQGERIEIATQIACKERAVRLSPVGGTVLEPVADELQEAAALSDEQARRIAECSRMLGAEFGSPQDVEWAIDRAGRLLLLQTRPITALGPPPVSGERRLWDNSNIVESYSGVVSPLTFSFARSVYEDVYLQFCRIMGVEEALLVEHRHVFASMLGLIRGRVYYNLLNWYRVLALLPGFSFNRAFMERMMGVSQKLEDPPEPPKTAGKWQDLGRLIRMCGRMVSASRRLPRDVPAFHARVEASLGPLAREDLSAWSADDLAALYRRLEADLLRHWRAPLVNDFFAMIFFGVLCKLIEGWLCGAGGKSPAPPTLANDLLCGEGGIISTEPARRVMALARDLNASPEVAALFERERDDGRLWTRLSAEPAAAEFFAALQAYLERFGDRCMNELKLETVTLSEDPGFLLQMIRAYSAQGAVDPAEARAREVRIRTEAEAKVRAALSRWRRPLFFWVMRHARARVRDRENLRFERTRVFGVVRRIFLGLGRRLAEQGRLEQPRDAFFLTREEIFGCLDGTGIGSDIKSLAALRKAEFVGYEITPPPPERFETFGPPDLAAPPTASSDPQYAIRNTQHAILNGMGCCPGIVRAAVRIVRDPRDAGDLTGHILVAERTDPGWTLLFPAALGLLVQRGSLLSHSAIVAREMGLPCIVGVPRLLETLRDGEEVEMDGASGLIRRVEAGGEACD